MSHALWKSATVPPQKAGTYLVGNRDTGEVGQARYMPKKREWKFPSAQMAFVVQAWDDMPKIGATQ